MHPEDKRKVIHVNFFPAEIDEVYFPQLNIIGDIAENISQLEKVLEPNAKQWNTEFFLGVKKNVSEHLSKYENDDRFPILHQRAVKII